MGSEQWLLCAAGFLQQFAAVIDDSQPHLHLAKALAELSGGRQPNRVIMTGHSLGGALATLGTAPGILIASRSSISHQIERCLPAQGGLGGYRVQR